MTQIQISIILFILSVFGQTDPPKFFQTTEYLNGIITKEFIDTINVKKDKIDIYFYKEHFQTPYILPNKFIDKKYKAITISKWAFKDKKKDHLENWQHTYTYDSLSRLTNYTFSGCAICSNLAYNYKVTYNSLGQIDNLKNVMFRQSGDTYKLYYDDKGQLIQLDFYAGGQLRMKIILLK